MEITSSSAEYRILGKQVRNRFKRNRISRYWSPDGGWSEIPKVKARPLGPFHEDKSYGDLMWFRDGYVNDSKHRKGTMATPYYRFTAEGSGQLNVGQNVALTWSGGRQARDKSSAKANARLFDLLQKAIDDAANLAMTAAEIGKSANMVAQAAQRIGNLAVAVLTRNPKRIANALGKTVKPKKIIVDRRKITIWHGDGTPVYSTIGGGVVKPKTITRFERKAVVEQVVIPSKLTPQGLWLELQFGWKPLLDDIHKSIEVLTRPRPQPYYASVSTKATTQLEGENYGKFSASATTRMRCKFSVVMTDDRAAWQKQMGLTNPALVMWDLVPFSFVIDWFGHVNKYLQGLDAFSGMEIKGSTFTKTNGYCSGEYPDIHWPYFKTFEGSFFECGRGGLPSNGSILDRFEIPELDSWKAVTSVALAMQQLSKLK